MSSVSRPGKSHASRSSQSASAWKDLPRRLFTVAIGVPSLILLLRVHLTSWLFFEGAHLLCLIEWQSLVPSSVAHADKENYDSLDTSAANQNASRTPRHTRQNVLSSVFHDNWRSLSDLERFQFLVFAVFSLAITILPTSAISMVSMFGGITLRFTPYFSPLQHCHSQSINALQTIQHYQFGLIYISFGFHFLLRICRDGGPSHIGFLLFIVWMSDTGALMFGRLLKQNSDCNGHATNHTYLGPLLSFLKSISPGKTLPGLCGALITGPLSAVVYPLDDLFHSRKIILLQVSFFHVTNHIIQKGFVGILLSIAGIVGDLAESSVKRMSGKKDSSELLPGHGGVVDRFDSLFTAGIVYYYCVLA
eukprot:CCRYP_013799-RA/>CCRYP_013799-RA protein AED:0.02 eAED:0.02 QI:95/-1/1/1/-1/0/1/305/362